MITSTIKNTVATYMTFNLDTMSVETRTETFDGELTEKEIEKKLIIKDNEKLLKVTGLQNEEKKYSMDESSFIIHSVLEKRKGVRYVNRTLHDTIAKCLYFDVDSMTTIEDEIKFKGEWTVDEVSMKMNKGKYEGSRKFLKVLEVSNYDTMFSVSEADFRKYGEIIEG